MDCEEIIKKKNGTLIVLHGSVIYYLNVIRRAYEIERIEHDSSAGARHAAERISRIRNDPCLDNDVYNSKNRVLRNNAFHTIARVGMIRHRGRVRVFFLNFIISKTVLPLSITK